MTTLPPWPASPPALSPPPPHAASGSASRAPAATASTPLLIFISIPPLSGYALCPIRRSGSASVSEDLAQEVLGPVALGCREERLRIVLLHDLSVGHEDDPIRCLARETHL